MDTLKGEKLLEKGYTKISVRVCVRIYVCVYYEGHVGANLVSGHVGASLVSSQQVSYWR